MRSSIGGWVDIRFMNAASPPDIGLTMNRWAVAGPANS